MNDRNAGTDLLNVIKTITDNYVKNRHPAAVLLGTFDGSAVNIGALPVPLSMITGNMKDVLKPGDQLRVLRNDGGKEYSIIEIVGTPYQMDDTERSPLAARVEYVEEEIEKVDTEAVGRLTEQVGAVTQAVAAIVIEPIPGEVIDALE